MADLTDAEIDSALARGARARLLEPRAAAARAKGAKGEARRKES
jgi:hypothetical protein